MSGRWFRFYADAMRNPKVARLTDKEFRLWVELLAVAAENEGAIPCLDDLKHLLKRRLDHLSTAVERLISLCLIDRLGDCYEPHHWAKFQYKSDTSTERVHKHRAKRNVSETPPETEADTETDTEEKEVGSSEPTPRAKASDKFPCPNGVDQIDWDALKANRKAKRAALTEGAHRQIIRKLETWARDGWPPGPIVAFAAEHGWTSVFETDEMKAPRNGHRNGNPISLAGVRGQRPNPALDMVLQAERELQAEADREAEGDDRPARLALPSRELGRPRLPPGHARLVG